MTGDYIVGLTDGEGCFYVNIHYFRKYPKSAPQVQTHFYLKLRNDDLIILKQVKKWLNLGHIYYQKEKRSNHSPCYRYEISNRDELKKLIQFFEKFPLHSPKKIKDFERIKKIFQIIDSKEHLTKKGINRISKLKLRMHS
ncbi:MAG: LAGLIDADG family homing endonuclease [Patescibacteria group bacterium]